tara:strand:- start:405 stop:632 length:228 start_codon:yes stop_codon:yes gene_type:complete
MMLYFSQEMVSQRKLLKNFERDSGQYKLSLTCMGLGFMKLEKKLTISSGIVFSLKRDVSGLFMEKGSDLLVKNPC